MQDTLLTAESVSKWLSLSRRTLFRLKSSGKIPAAVRIGGAVRWRHADIERWIALGCPDRKSFEALGGEQR